MSSLPFFFFSNFCSFSSCILSLEIYLLYSISIIFLNDNYCLKFPYNLVKSFLCSSNNSIKPSISPMISHQVRSPTLLDFSFSKVRLSRFLIFYPPPLELGSAPSVMSMSAERVWSRMI